MPDDRLIVGLDLPDAATARAMVATLGDAVGFYKVGLGLLSDGGLELATELRASGKSVFLDMKLFDIGTTVAAAARGIIDRIAPEFLTVHGDPYVVEAAAAARGDAPTRILAVTVLTSLDRSDLDSALILDGEVPAIVVERARRAFAAGADGVIASPREAAALSALPQSRGKLIVTPGIRPAGAAAGNQKRVATPAAALAAGATHIVVARPVLSAPCPRAAIDAIVAEMSA